MLWVKVMHTESPDHKVLWHVPADIRFHYNPQSPDAHLLCGRFYSFPQNLELSQVLPASARCQACEHAAGIGRIVGAV